MEHKRLVSIFGVAGSGSMLLSSSGVSVVGCATVRLESESITTHV
jgi:hypothetical protein